jgi:hypothetical protein
MHGKPTSAYAVLKNKSMSKKAIADGIRKGYAGLYEADENAHSLPPDQLKGLVAQVSGTEEAMTKLIALTFGTLVKLADFTATAESATFPSENGAKEEAKAEPPVVQQVPVVAHATKFNPEFRFNIEVHLPSNGTEETYLNIFNALRKTLA